MIENYIREYQNWNKVEDFGLKVPKRKEVKQQIKSIIQELEVIQKVYRKIFLILLLRKSSAET